MQGLEAEIERLLAHPRFDHAAHRLAQGFLAVQAVAPRLASQFSTQQRWLMSHAVLSHYFRGLSVGRPGLSRRDFVEQALTHGLASRNTAAAFFVEALQYGLVQPTKVQVDLVQPAPATLQALIEWYAIHLAARDLLDGGASAARLRGGAGESILLQLEPATADALLSCEAIRTPPPSYAVFGSVDEGGNLMDRLIAGMDMTTPRDADRALTDVTSVSALARPFNLSRTHTGRTLAEAMAMGSIGWSGAPGRSPIWLSRRFREEYARFQATKLAILGAAFAQAIAGVAPDDPALGATQAGREIAESPAC
ncbi:MAG TPA: hypothetical protein VGN91_28390 [Bosea sp. (in: a-proteobacteria)]|nr:hypothetical protein [Bosea sp. (in: a-proteobacteria)]